MRRGQRRRLQFATLVSLALLAVGVWRVGAIVTAAPMLGYANQFDMRRISACVGLWPDVGLDAQLQAHPESPLSKYVPGPRRADECYLSSELLFVAPAVLMASTAGFVSLRLVGAIKAFALFAAAFALNVLLRSRPAWMMLHAVVFAVVICDPMNTLWMNSLYTEFSALLGAYAATVLLVLIAERSRGEAGVVPAMTAAFVCALVLLGLSRQQHALLPAVLAFPAAIALWRRQRRAVTAIVVTVALIAVAQLTVIGRHPTIAQANNADTALGAILPASTDQALTAHRLGLPDACLASVGATWYQPMGESLQLTCPQVFAMSRAAMLGLMLTEPVTVARAMLRALPQLQDWRLGYLGTVEGQAFGGAETVRQVAGSGAASMAAVVTAMTPSQFLLMLVASMIVLAGAAPLMIFSLVGQRNAGLVVTVYALSATVWYAIATSVLGDGYVEVARHAQLASVALYALFVVLLSACVHAAASLIGRRDGAAERATSRSTLAWIVVALVLAFAARAQIQSVTNRIPMSIGVLDLPRSNVVSGDGVDFSGWALDPLGAVSVELVTDAGAVFAARIGDPYTGARGEALGLYYPAYPGAAHAGFATRIPAASIDAAGTVVRTFVINVDGVRTEIDRRRLVRKAA